MYSPRIREALIPRVYEAARKAGIPMTAWVNRVIEEALRERTSRNESEVREANGSEGPAAESSGKEFEK